MTNENAEKIWSKFGQNLQVQKIATYPFVLGFSPFLHNRNLCHSYSESHFHLNYVTYMAQNC